MLVNILKFLHLLIIVSLLGSTLFCLVLVSTKKSSTISAAKYQQINLLNKLILWLATFAVLTGTFLVYPKHFTFHTPWIKAAYILIFLFGTLISSLAAFKKKSIPTGLVWCLYAVLFVLLIVVTHDAVTKTTFLFSFLR